MFCPACGESVSDIMEAHTVGPHPIGGSAFRPGTEPAGWCVVWPCGCTVRPDFARQLAAVPRTP